MPSSTPVPLPKLIFFLGPAAAGKTTIAKSLARKRHTAFFDMDTLLRPAAEVIMSISGLDPSDRDSPEYKKYCRDLGYRITMDAVLENIELGSDVFVVGPFTKETQNPNWLEQELSRIGTSPTEVTIKVIHVFLSDEELYRDRLRARGSELDVWKLKHWPQFRLSLQHKDILWKLPRESFYPLDNSRPLSQEKLSHIERWIECQP